MKGDNRKEQEQDKDDRKERNRGHDSEKRGKRQGKTQNTQQHKVTKNKRRFNKIDAQDVRNNKESGRKKNKCRQARKREEGKDEGQK